MVQQQLQCLTALLCFHSGNVMTTRCSFKFLIILESGVYGAVELSCFSIKVNTALTLLLASIYFFW